MKDRITLTLELDILERLDKEMLKHQMRNKSKFIEFILRNVLFSPKQRLQLLERQRDQLLVRFKAINEDVVRMQDHCALLDQAREKLTSTEEVEDPGSDKLNDWE